MLNSKTWADFFGGGSRSFNDEKIVILEVLVVLELTEEELVIVPNFEIYSRRLCKLFGLLALVAAMFCVQFFPTESSCAFGSELTIVGDTNRDGVVDSADLSIGKSSWTWGSGALIMPNLDDDDRDGKADALDTWVNGSSDLSDLARFEVDVSGAARLAFEWGSAPLHAFAQNPSTGNWDIIAAGKSVALSTTDELKLVIGIEAYKLVGQGGWSGKAELRVRAYDATGAEVASDQVSMRATSWIMLPNSARTKKLYFATGYYNNGNMLDQLRAIVPTLNAEFPSPHRAKSWYEMWMQDSLEMGYLEIPGSRMHMVLNGLRNHDTFGPSLLGPDVGVFSIGTYRELGTSGPDSWVDWFGNLEVSHPTAEFPLGRVYYGMNTATGRHLQDDVVNFIKAQEVQSPFWVDTSWLIIKHVDELFNFIPGPDGQGILYVVSPRAASQALGKPLDTANGSIQKQIDKMLHGGSYEVAGQGAIHYPGILKLLGWETSRVVPLPLLFDGATSAHNLWSNPVNSVFINGDVITGMAQMPVAIRSKIEQSFKGQGVAKVHFVDDKAYQDNLGNVHCSSNTMRMPLFSSYWSALPGFLD